MGSFYATQKQATASETLEDIILALSTSGSDTTATRPKKLLGGDWSAKPFASIAGALATLPKILRHHVTINAGAGTFTACPLNNFIMSALTMDGEPMLRIRGSTAAASPTTGVASGLCGAGSTTSAINKPAAAANWTASDAALRGKWVMITAGLGAPITNQIVIGIIKDNTTTQLTLQGTLTRYPSWTNVPVTIDTTSQFAIVDVATIFAAGTIFGTQNRVFEINDIVGAVSFELLSFGGGGANSGLAFKYCIGASQVVACKFDGANSLNRGIAAAHGSPIAQLCYFKNLSVYTCQLLQPVVVQVLNSIADTSGPLIVGQALNCAIANYDSKSPVSDGLQLNQCPNMSLSGISVNSGAANGINAKQVAKLALSTCTGSGNAGFGVALQDGRASIPSAGVGNTITGTSGDVSVDGATVTYATVAANATIQNNATMVQNT